MALAGEAEACGYVTFVAANTRPNPVPLCPEITLRVADRAVPLWLKTAEEIDDMGISPPFWAFAWAGGQALARFVLDQPKWVRGKRVLDLGAGSGLVGIAARLSGAASVTCADPDPWAQAAIELNADMNAVQLDLTGQNLLALPEEPLPFACDIVLVGDLFYEQPLAERVLRFLSTQRAADRMVLIGDPGRSYLPKDRLVRMAEYGVPAAGELEDADIKRTAVWRLA